MGDLILSADLAEPLDFPRGPAWRNRVALAPLTNMQSHADGTLGDDELAFLARRTEGGFGMVMTCASHVHTNGQAFPGQLGTWSDAHIPGLARLAQAIRAGGQRVIGPVAACRGPVGPGADRGGT